MLVVLSQQPCCNPEGYFGLSWLVALLELSGDIQTIHRLIRNVVLAKSLLTVSPYENGGRQLLGVRKRLLQHYLPGVYVCQETESNNCCVKVEVL